MEVSVYRQLLFSCLSRQTQFGCDEQLPRIMSLQWKRSLRCRRNVTKPRQETSRSVLGRPYQDFSTRHDWPVKEAIANSPIILNGNSKHTSGNSLNPVGVQNKDLTAASQTLLTGVRLRWRFGLWKPNLVGFLLTAAGLAQSVERLTAEREVAGSIPGAGPLLRVLK